MPFSFEDMLVPHATGAYFNEKVIHCGGFDDHFKSECYLVHGDFTIEFIANMTENRYNLASAIIGNKLWLTGGWNGIKRLNSTDYLVKTGSKYEIQSGTSDESMNLSSYDPSLVLILCRS